MKNLLGAFVAVVGIAGASAAYAEADTGLALDQTASFPSSVPLPIARPHAFGLANAQVRFRTARVFVARPALERVAYADRASIAQRSWTASFPLMVGVGF